MYTVTRQLQWPAGQHMVEVSYGSLDYTNPDALSARYPGEFKTFHDPREAVETAITIQEQWQHDTKDKKVHIGVGDTMGMTMPFEADTPEAVTKWAEKEYESLTKCPRCGDVIEDDEGYTIEMLEEVLFCSEQCAENEYRDLHCEEDDDEDEE